MGQRNRRIEPTAEWLEAYTNGTFDGDQIYPRTATLLDVVEQHTANHAAHPSGHILMPQWNADPSKVDDRVKNLRMPTGYFKVVYRPPSDAEPAYAIGFLLPHGFENLNQIPNVPSDEAFWAFVARIDLIEETSGISFRGIPNDMKAVWGDPFSYRGEPARTFAGRTAAWGRRKGLCRTRRTITGSPCASTNSTDCLRLPHIK